MSTINQRLFKILTEYYAHSREFRNAARQADDRTLLAARDHLAQRNRDQSKSGQIREIDSTYRFRFGQAAPATNKGSSGPTAAGGYAASAGSAIDQTASKKG